MSADAASGRITNGDLRDALHQFGYPSFRAGQAEAIQAVVTGRDAVVLMPTGGGKSLCYQIPATVFRRRGLGTGIVISPLIALMNDQVAHLRAKGIAAGALHSAQDELEQREVIAHLLTNKLDLLYVSPERVAFDGFRRLAARAAISMLAIDEAHCISQWGHDFRPDYLKLGAIRQMLNVPTMALTATATEKVLNEIAVSLSLEDPARVVGRFVRPNLGFTVHFLSSDADRLAELIDLLERHGLRDTRAGRAIVYCATRKTVEAVAPALKQRGYAAGYYHAGRSDNRRDTAQRAFGGRKTNILVATNAFGMGIDHPDVRLIVHFQSPGSVEAYYQEAGRAGRDGRPAQCALFFGLRDLVTQRFLNRKSATRQAHAQHRDRLLQGMVAYVQSTHCRQQSLVEYFTGQAEAPCTICDLCRDPETVSAQCQAAFAPNRRTAPRCTPLTEAEQEQIVRAVANLRRPVGKTMLARALRGSRARALRRFGLLDCTEHGSLRAHSEQCLLGEIERLVQDGRLERRGMKYPTVWLAGRPVRAKNTTARTPRTRRRPKNALGTALENYRRRRARSLHWKRYMVFTNDVVRQLVDIRPDSLAALHQIRGLGSAKIERFGPDLLDLIRRYGAPDDTEQPG